MAAETPRVQIKTGVQANLPTSSMLRGEQFVTTDRHGLYIATDATTTINVVPLVDQLTAFSSVDGANDLLFMHDASATGVKEKKITFSDFKSALNIPAASSDEMVAVVSGGTAGYLWGTDGTDGIVRVDASLQMIKDSGNGFITLSAGTINCGEF